MLRADCLVAAAAPIEHTGKQLSAFIRKVEILASGYVGLIHHWICLLITTIVFPLLELVHIFLNAVHTQDLGKLIPLNYRIYLWCASL